MLSKMCQTSVRAVIFLCSKRHACQKSGIKEIALHINSSEHTVGKILQTLVKQQIINSIKGPSGGFYISESQQQLPIWKIIEAIDGKERFISCGLGLSKCSEIHPCPIHHQYKEVRHKMEEIFRTKKVIDLCQPVNEGFAYLMG